VPGHGPMVGKDGVREFKAYLQYVWDETKKRYDAGMGWLDAAFDIVMGDFDHWGDAERMVPNVMAIWGELSGTRPVASFEELWALMARYYKGRERRRADLAAACGCGNPNHRH